jgi:undecaprenyl diphosphate synthase
MSQSLAFFVYFRIPQLMGHWLNRTNVECVSIYGWSILNFGRKESEVADAMKLMTETLKDFATLCVSRGQSIFKRRSC